MFEAGDRIADFEVLARLRSGGMATLYLARRRGAAGFAKHVAVKVIDPKLASDEMFIEMFVDEAKLSARIHHPNVVHVEELGEIDGTYFLAMEYVHGCSLAELLRELGKQKRRLAPELAAYIGIKVADGLHAAHETTDGKGALLGVVHRDVSPQNVLLGYKGHVKLIDFGIAKAAGRTHQTSGSTLKGKFRYMSPEQAKGDEIDRRTDVYALGIVLWEMLAGRRLFDAQTDLKVLDVVRDPKVRRPSELVSGVPRALEEVIMAALEPDLERRLATAKDVRRGLARALPEAAALDADLLADLLRSVMSEHITRDLRVLPESFSGVIDVSGSQREPAEAKAMTVALTDADLVPIESAMVADQPTAALTPVAVAGGSRVSTRLAIVIAAGVGLAGAGLALAIAGGDDAGSDGSTTSVEGLLPGAAEESTAPPPIVADAPRVDADVDAGRLAADEAEAERASEEQERSTERETTRARRDRSREDRAARRTKKRGPLLVDDVFF